MRRHQKEGESLPTLLFLRLSWEGDGRGAGTIPIDQMQRPFLKNKRLGRAGENVCLKANEVMSNKRR